MPRESTICVVGFKIDGIAQAVERSIIQFEHSSSLSNSILLPRSADQWASKWSDFVICNYILNDSAYFVAKGKLDAVDQFDHDNE